jgi:putative endopeptidase
MIKSKRIIFTLSLAGTVIASCNTEPNAEEETVQAINLNYMDSTVRFQDDFFLAVNGNWIKQTEIPADQGRWGSFNELREFNNEAVLKVLEEAMNSADLPAGSDQAKGVAFYQIGMDSLLAERKGAEPLKPWFEKIEQVKDGPSLQAYLAEQQQYGGGAFFSLGVNTDLKDSDRMALYVSQSGLGLPDRDYYLGVSEKFDEIKAKYQDHVAASFQLVGYEEAAAKQAAEAVLELETRLAKSSKSRIELRDPEGRYNKYDLEGMSALTPSLDWKNYLAALNADTEEVIVSTPAFMEEVDRIIKGASYDAVRAYLKWKVIDRAAPYLSHDFVKANFDFYGRELEGTQEMRPRWKRVLATTEGAVGEAIGKLYTEEYFPQEAKEKAQEMVDNVIEAMGDRIRQLEWMTDVTKEKALEKLGTFNVKIGFPDKWKDYGALKVSSDPETASYIQNVWNTSNFRFKDNISKLGKAIDKDEWFMTPQTVNAYYNPTWNEIVFPAGILQPPFYDYKADAAVNYGGIGAVIGHEISHGFDDQGSRYDAEGNLQNWWQEEDLKNFQERTGKLVAQYDAYEPLEGVNVQGKLTLGENIGDLGGLLVAYDGLQRHLQEHGRPENIDGFSPEQRFFISRATIWRMKSRDEALRTQIQTDPHSPAQYRGNGPLVNIDAFYEAFDVKEGDQMYKAPEERVRIW